MEILEEPGSAEGASRSDEEDAVRERADVVLKIRKETGVAEDGGAMEEDRNVSGWKNRKEERLQSAEEEGGAKGRRCCRLF